MPLKLFHRIHFCQNIDLYSHRHVFSSLFILCCRVRILKNHIRVWEIQPACRPPGIPVLVCALALTNHFQQFWFSTVKMPEPKSGKLLISRTILMRYLPPTRAIATATFTSCQSHDEHTQRRHADSKSLPACLRLLSPIDALNKLDIIRRGAAGRHFPFIGNRSTSTLYSVHTS